MANRHTLFEKVGAHVLVDGQFGSTGKGVLAAWLAKQNLDMSDEKWAGVISNAGPNSGHTFYHNDEKHVLKQLPTFAVASYLMGLTIPVFLSAGAIIDPDILRKEAGRYPGIPIFVHPNAAVITPHDKHSEADPTGSIAAVAGTRSGTGMALARKIMRDPTAIAITALASGIAPNVDVADFAFDSWNSRYFIEVSQGFSLGINQQFYPKCTSRECTVAQAIADAAMPPRSVAKTYMSIRTYPIRVGNVDGHSSGNWYPDQQELTWEQIGVEPELTTVTQRERRVATFSAQQFRDAIDANDPEFVFVNFLNYLKTEDFTEFRLRLNSLRASSNRWFDILGGWGPKSEDVLWLA